jgi:hypothetical protein
MPMGLYLLSGRTFYLWTTLIALIIEFAAIIWIFRVTWRRALLASLVANGATLFLGIAAYMHAIAWIYSFIPNGSFDGLAESLSLIALIDTAIELVVLAVLFAVILSWKRAFAFLAVNFVSAALILVTPLVTIEESEKVIPAAELQRIEEYYAPEIRYMEQVGEALRQGEGFAKSAQKDANPRSADGYLDQIWLAERRSEANDLRFHALQINASSKRRPEKGETWESWYVLLVTAPSERFAGSWSTYLGTGCSETSSICYSRVNENYTDDFEEGNDPDLILEVYLAKKTYSSESYDVRMQAYLPRSAAIGSD